MTLYDVVDEAYKWQHGIPSADPRPDTRPKVAFAGDITNLVFCLNVGRWWPASDYPHPDSVWPHSREAIERQMRSLTPAMRRALTHDNAAALYGLA